MVDVTARPPWRLSDEEETEFRRRCPIATDVRAELQNFDQYFGVTARLPYGSWHEILFVVHGPLVIYEQRRPFYLAAAAAYFMAIHDGQAAP